LSRRRRATQRLVGFSQASSERVCVERTDSRKVFVVFQRSRARPTGILDDEERNVPALVLTCESDVERSLTKEELAGFDVQDRGRRLGLMTAVPSFAAKKSALNPQRHSRNREDKKRAEQTKVKYMR